MHICFKNIFLLVFSKLKRNIIEDSAYVYWCLQGYGNYMIFGFDNEASVWLLDNSGSTHIVGFYLLLS